MADAVIGNLGKKLANRENTQEDCHQQKDPCQDSGSEWRIDTFNHHARIALFCIGVLISQRRLEPRCIKA